MLKKLKTFDLWVLIGAVVAIGLLVLVALTLLVLVPQQPILIPFVVTTLLGLLSAVVYHFFPRRSSP